MFPAGLTGLLSTPFRSTAERQLIGRAFSTAIAAAGIVPALAGSVTRVPNLPGSSLLAAGVSVLHHQPALRQQLERMLGRELTDLILESAKSVTDVVTQAPAALTVDLGLRSLLLGEAWSLRNASQEWGVAVSSEVPDGESRGQGERHAERVALAQLASGAVIGAVTQNSEIASTAVRVAAPRALRISREAFAAVLTRELWQREGSLVVDPGAARRLDRVDTVLIDPRVLLTQELRVADIRGVADSDRVHIWNRSRRKLGNDKLTVGWHRIGGADVLVRPTRKPLAQAVVAELRTAGVRAVSLDVDTLGSLRGGFDELLEAPGDSDRDVDRALESALTTLSEAGAHVCVVSSVRLSGPAELRIGVAEPDRAPPSADILEHDLAGVWRVLHALPAARAATRRGVELSSGASVLGALVMLPGVRGRGPGPITVGAGAALWTGFRLARSAVGVEVPEGSSRNDWHELGTDEVLHELPSPDEKAPAETRSGRLARVAAPVRVGRDVLDAVRSELSDPLTPVLATGSAASAILGSPIDAFLVGSVLTGNATLSAIQRLHSEHVVRELLRVQEPLARRVSNGSEPERVPADQLGIGNILVLESGDVVPADARLLDVDSLEVDESSLTGESMPVEKQTDPTPGVPVAERSCMIYAGTTVVAGAARAVVTAVGSQTEARKVDVRAPQRGPEVGLTHRLRDLTRKTLPVSLGGGALVTALGLLRGTALRQAVTGGVAVAVAAVPEGLPLVATLAQQAAARRLTSVGALVRSPRSIEALGRVDVVCFDKTGTLSENHLHVAAVERVDGWRGNRILEVAARSALSNSGDQVFHSTDAAVVSAADDVLAHPLVFEDAEASAMVPFRSGRPYSAALIGHRIALKGSPEFVSHAAASKKRVSSGHVKKMAKRGLRVIAVAQRELSESAAQRAAHDPEFLEECCAHDLEPVGLLGLSDTLRSDAGQLVAELRDRGLGVRVITGDHPLTAAAVAGELGLDVDPDDVLTGSEWENMSHTEKEAAVAERTVFARMTPEHKVQVVHALESSGSVCAMVGDGANDAAAIRAASVGIGVASSGSDPARGAADIVLLEGRVSGLIDALDEGAQLWQRVRSAVGVLLGGNAGEVAFALMGSALSGISPLNARQMLLVNLMTDALPAAALAVSTPTAEGRSDTPATDADALWRTIAVRGGATAAGALSAWILARMTGRARRASTVALVALVGTQLGQTLIESRSPLVVATAVGSVGVLSILVSTPVVSQFLGCTPLGPLAWAQAIGCACGATTLAAVASPVIERLVLPENKS
ncbi:MAG: cation-translocating P-type ATPase [Rhodococcus sp. (in: high G+C Gram-positive bacteria)]|uniref:cation-translocating P-type ATPase n=1 Tax=Rhodococcus sp. TaxID=1831 RepID=UPI001214F220|nr:cation-translocating P-type ATPase [Rhodococcus sp. (in: high G+C Gram-positive bacteria)]RZL21099.1 MAG: cation-translocating P-type ATPase [Rhodococcus sp. (in: high G+C Gram-positive bacteria)]